MARSLTNVVFKGTLPRPESRRAFPELLCQFRPTQHVHRSSQLNARLSSRRRQQPASSSFPHIWLTSIEYPTLPATKTQSTSQVIHHRECKKGEARETEIERPEEVESRPQGDFGRAWRSGSYEEMGGSTRCGSFGDGRGQSRSYPCLWRINF